MLMYFYTMRTDIILLYLHWRIMCTHIFHSFFDVIELIIKIRDDSILNTVVLLKTVKTKIQINYSKY